MSDIDPGGSAAQDRPDEENSEDPNPPSEEESARLTDHTIAIAQVSFAGLFEPGSVRAAVAASWTPGLTKVLYRREWILTKILEETELGYFGRIGFVREGEVNTLKYDEEKNDFVEGQAPAGVTVPFFLSHEGKISFQLISNVVSERTFVRAFQELMNSSNAHFDWIVTPLAYESEYKIWSETVERVVKFDFTLDRPNPHYGDDHLIEMLVEETQAEHLRFAGTAAADGSIDTNSEPFQQALDHVIRNYGRATVTGVDNNNEETIWTKSKGFASKTLAKFRTRGPGPQATREELVFALSNLSTGSTPVDIDDTSDEIAG